MAVSVGEGLRAPRSAEVELRDEVGPVRRGCGAAEAYVAGG